MPPRAAPARTRTRDAIPSVSRSLTVTARPAGSPPGRPAARGLPCGLRADSVTFGTLSVRAAAPSPSLSPSPSPPSARLPGHHRGQVVVVVLGARVEPGLAPAVRRRRQRVRERVRPVLPGEARPVRRGPPVAVDPHPARPAGAGAQQRHPERPVRRHHAARRAPVEQRHRPVGQRRLAGERPGAVGHHGAQLPGWPARPPARPAPSPARPLRGRDDQHRQVTRPAQVRVRRERRGARPRGGHPQPCPGPVGDQRGELLGHRRFRRREDLRGERVLRRAAERDPEVRQVGVHVDRPVARPGGPRAGRRDAGPRQRDEQIPDEAGDLRCWMTSGVITSATPIADRHLAPGRGEHRARDRPDTEPLVRRVVEGPRVRRRVRFRRAERPSDHRRRRLVHRQPAGRGGGEADPQHPVLADRPRQAGAELHPVRAVPQQGLGGDRQVAEREGGDQPRPGGGALRAHGRGRRGGASRPLVPSATGARGPRPSAGACRIPPAARVRCPARPAPPGRIACRAPS